jgi:site-specific DNA-methyltransferase (adenine-specific)
MLLNVIYNKSFYFIPEVEDESVDLVYVDPPYNISHGKQVKHSKGRIGYQSNKGEWDHLSDHDYDYLNLRLALDSYRVLHPGGSIFVSGNIGSLFYFWKHCSLFEFKHHIVWHKTNPAPSVHRRSLTYSNEFILWLYKPGAKWKFNYEVAKSYNNGKQLHDMWDIAAVRKRCGVTKKPPALINRIINIFSDEGDVVLDPCVGSGTTCIEALNLGRSYVGYEVLDDCIDFMKENGLKIYRRRLYDK